MRRGYQWKRPHDVHFGRRSPPRAAASQNTFVSGLAILASASFFTAILFPPQDQCGFGVPRSKRAAGPLRQSKPAVAHLHFRVRLAAQLPHRLDDFGHAAAICGMIVAKTAAIGVERQLADARDKIAVGDETAALTFCAEAEIFELHQNRDRETVVDRSVLNVAW